MAEIENLENAKLNRGHLKIMLISGMSFFTDAYDLFVIGVVLLMLVPVFSLSTAEIGILASAALFGAVVGPLLFGYIGDKVGRKYAYWITITILIIGAIGSSLSSSYVELLVWRFILGIGIGGDYPLSSTIIAEYANKDDRGKLISSTFSMQGFGLITGIGLAFLLLSLNVNTTVAWRILLAFGALPPLLILRARTKIYETPWYSISKGKQDEAASAISQVSGNVKQESSSEPFRQDIPAREFFRKRKGIVFGAAISWLLIDIAYYGTTIFTPYLSTFFGFSGIYAPVRASAIILMLSAVPGYWVAVALIDKIGRKTMQVMGFTVMALAYILLSVIGSFILSTSMLFFFAIYAIAFFFTNFGPNTTTYVYPAELYPTSLRARGHGISAMSGKFGAALSTLFFPTLIALIGKFNLLGLLGTASLAGALITLAFLPETKKKSLTETSGEAELTLVTSTLHNEFKELISHINKASLIISSSFEGSRVNGYELFAKVKEEEHNADMVVQKIMSYITSVKLNSTIYMDVSHLARRLDDIIDAEETVTSRIAIYRVSSVDRSMREFSQIIVNCVEIVGSALNAMEILLSEGEGAERMKHFVKAMAIEENRADELLRSSLKDLMAAGNAMNILRRKEIYENLEATTDRCQDAMDIMSDITLRYIYSR